MEYTKLKMSRTARRRLSEYPFDPGNIHHMRAIESIVRNTRGVIDRSTHQDTPCGCVTVSGWVELSGQWTHVNITMRGDEVCNIGLDFETQCPSMPIFTPFTST